MSDLPGKVTKSEIQLYADDAQLIHYFEPNLSHEGSDSINVGMNQ